MSSTPAKPATAPNTRRMNVHKSKNAVQVVPIRMFVAEVQNEKTGAQLFLGVELGGVFYAFPKGKDMVNLDNLSAGFTPFSDDVQAQIKKHLDGTQPVEQGAASADVPTTDAVSVV